MTCDNFEPIMEEIIAALIQAGYNPREQIHNYIQTGESAYITRYNDARNKISKLNTAQIWQYITLRGLRAICGEFES